MTLTSAFNGALSGLQAFAKMSEVISSNISNATTPAYATRSVELVSNDRAAGVAIQGTSRQADPGVISARRSTEAQAAGADILATFYAKMMDTVGTPDDSRSLSAHLARFETSLIEAGSFPDAPARLNAVAQSADELARSLNRAADALSDARGQADTAIATDVATLNAALQALDTLNTKVMQTQLRGMDTSGLLDQRQALVDEVNVLVPVKEIVRPSGQIALFTQGGAILLDGIPATFGFEAVNTVTPYQSLSDGTLSGLTLNGIPVETSAALGPISGGALAARFAVRDDAAVATQSQLDAVSRQLIDRLQNAAVDPSRSPTDPGLFTDGGAVFDVSNEVGIANRIAINPRIDPSASDETWRLRTGLAAAIPGPVGDAGLLNAMSNALTGRAPLVSGDLGLGDVTAAQAFSRLSSWVGLENATSERQQVFLTAGLTQARQAELATGVDTDAELQTLLLVERAYAANAQVLQTVDDMIETLLRVT